MGNKESVMSSDIDTKPVDVPDFESDVADLDPTKKHGQKKR